MNRRRTTRTPQSRITPEAVAAFVAGDAAALHRALSLPPWAPSPLEVDGGPCPWPAGTGGAATWPEMVELRDALEAAARRPA